MSASSRRDAATAGMDAAPPQGTVAVTSAGGYDLIRRALKRAAPGSRKLPRGALLNMELSQLAFMERVLELAADPAFPLLERVRFVAIFGSNLDEFFMTRVAGFQRQLGLGHPKRTLDGLQAAEQLHLIRERIDVLLGVVYGEILPQLRRMLTEYGIEVMRWDELEDRDRATLLWQCGPNLDYLLMPLPVHPGRPFPHIRNLRPALAVQLRDAGKREQLSLVAFPGEAPSLIPLAGGRRFLPLEELLRVKLPRLLAGSEVVGAHLFRVARSGNLSVQPDLPRDVVELVAEIVAQRPFEPVVRVEVEEGMPAELQAHLLRGFAEGANAHSSHLAEENLYRIPGLIDLKRLEGLANLPLPELKHLLVRRTTPLPSRLTIFERIRRSPVLVRFPQHTFAGTAGRFIKEAAQDPAVEDIRITLYRTNRTSRIVRLLRLAHRNGKRVVVFIEVKASFDERRNIEWGRSLEAEGIRVLYGPPSLKVHSKIAIVRRREDDRLSTYSFIGTGNLNASTAATYTDLGLFTADPEVGAELIDLFDALADDPARGEYRHLIVAPFNLRQRLLELIERETEHARAGRGGSITAKLNGIADREIIAALYDASRAGVQIDLIVRGICSVRPGVQGQSDNIRVVSNAGRYLEHSRIVRFGNAGEPEYYIGSADWRGRNLSRRVEVVVPVTLESHCRTLDGILNASLTDDRAWDLLPSGEYRRRNSRQAF